MVRIVRIRVFDQSIDGFAILGHGVENISPHLKDRPELFQEGNTSWANRQILSQQGLGEPVVLPLKCFVDE
jgi:hypothetical protein